MAADGSIVIQTEIDNKQANRELQQLSKKIGKLEQDLSGKQTKQSAIKSELDAATDAALETEKAVARLKRELAQTQSVTSGQTSVSPAEYLQTVQHQEILTTQLREQEALLRQQNSDAQKLGNQYTRITDQVIQTSKNLDSAKSRAGELQLQMERTSSSTKEMPKAISRMEKGMSKFSSRLREVVRSALVFTIISQGLAQLREWLGLVIKQNKEAAEAIGRLKGALMTLAQPIINVLIPAITFLANALSKIISVVSSFVSMLFGSSLQDSADAAQGLYDESNALNAVGSSAKKASKQLASFDEINKLSGDSAGRGSAGTDSIVPDFSESGDLSWLESTLGKAAGWVTAALLIGGIALVAIGAATGRISLVLAGLLMLGSGITVGTETGVFGNWAEALGLENAAQFVPMALAIGGIALIVLGAAMGQVLMVIAGLGLIGAGIAVAVSNGSAGYWADKLGLDSVFDYVTAAIQLAGLAFIAIGAAMGNIFMVIAGGLIVGAGIAAENIGEEKLKQWWEVLKLTTVQQWVSVALLLLGIALVAIGAAMGNILMVLAGAGLIGFGAVVAAQNGNLKDWVTALGLEKVAGWVTAALLLLGIGLVVFGIATGNIVMVLAGAGLIGAGVAVGATSGTFNTWIDMIITGLKSCWDSITEVWNSTIAPALESIAGFFKDYVIDPTVELFKGLYNGVVGILEGIVNGFIGIINAFIRGINLAIETINKIPGVEIGTLKEIKTVSIPRLAQGAVIPPNREFMAVLGDQQSGTNIETPLSTMVQAFKQALSDMGYAGQNEAVLVVDGQQFGKLVYKYNNQESRRVGVRLTEGWK